MVPRGRRQKEAGSATHIDLCNGAIRRLRRRPTLNENYAVNRVSNMTVCLCVSVYINLPDSLSLTRFLIHEYIVGRKRSPSNLPCSRRRSAHTPAGCRGRPRKLSAAHRDHVRVRKSAKQKQPLCTSRDWQSSILVAQNNYRR